MQRNLPTNSQEQPEGTKITETVKSLNAHITHSHFCPTCERKGQCTDRDCGRGYEKLCNLCKIRLNIDSKPETNPRPFDRYAETTDTLLP